MSSAIIVDTEELDAGTVDKLRAAIAAVLAEAGAFEPDPAAVLGWSPAAIAEFGARLAARNRTVQLAALRHAADNGGSVDRDTVYRLGGYAPERSLNGFTKPVKGVMRELVAEGMLPADAPHPLAPRYDPAASSIQRAQGFEMPAELAGLFATNLGGGA
ncbi:hypothetical protein [Geodermatophilus sp. CPCC 206100]|uniref:hypothetical protein n=1 Tax=Geodermatophilus sp. CPCC 206100 TaxID=3020054 RepID=UPI003AFFC3F1